MTNVYSLNSSFLTGPSVRSESLFPQQRKSPQGFLRSADCYQQKFVKFPHIGVFHSYAELIHAALLEGDREISTFTPQPFLLYVGKRRYTPDCYLVRMGEREVIELKPDGEMKDEIRIPVESYFQQGNIKFTVIANDEVLSKERLGLNWLKIIRVLISAVNKKTELQELKILSRLYESENLEVGDIIFSGNRVEKAGTEVALFRLAHSGKAILDLDNRPLSYSTKVSLCT